MSYIAAQKRRSPEAKKRGDELPVEVEDIRSVYNIFMDMERSREYIANCSNKLVFNVGPEESEPTKLEPENKDQMDVA